MSSFDKYYKSLDNLLAIFNNSVKYFYTTKNPLIITDDTFKSILDKIIDIYKKILNCNKSELRFEKSEIKSDVNSNSYILFNQDQYDILLKILKTIFDIYKFLCDENENDLKEKIQNQIYDLLIFSASKENCQIEIDYILNKLYNCMSSDKSLSIVYYHYYTIIFDKFRKDKFKRIYLNIFNNYAYRCIKYVLDIGNLKIFKNIIYCSIVTSSDIYNSNEENENIKLQEFRKLFLKITSFLLYKKDYDALDILFNYHTPKDCVIDYLDKDILPRSLKEVFEWTSFNDNLLLEEIEDRHSVSYYYNILTYLLILRASYNNGKINKNITLSDIENISLLNFHTLQQLNSKALKNYHQTTKFNDKDLKNSRNQILSIINSIFQNKKLLEIIGINNNNITKIKYGFIELLFIISELINKQEENIIKKAECSEDIVNNFRNEIFENYTENPGLLSVFNQYDLVCYEHYNNLKTLHIGYNMSISKEMFIKNYHISFLGFTYEYIKGLRKAEDYKILNELQKKSQLSYIDDIGKLIDNFSNKDNLFIIFNNANINSIKLQCKLNIILKSKYFFSKAEQDDFSKYCDLINFYGVLIYKDISIPVYSYFVGNYESQLFLLSQSKEDFGNIVEYIYEGEDKKYFDEKTKLFCKLSELEDKKSIHLQLYKRLEINLLDTFTGYIIPLSNI